MPAVALLSAFTHHLTTTAVMLPVTLDLAREKDLPPSRLLMPLSFAASRGGGISADDLAVRLAQRPFLNMAAGEFNRDRVVVRGML